MWYREPNNNILNCESSYHTLNLLWRKNNIYVMDNHLAAGWCWMNSLSPHERYNFFHVDRHEDLCGGLAKQDDLDRIKNLFPFSIDDYCYFTFDRGKDTPQYPFNKVFSWDTYIKQTQYMFPNWFDSCYFACPNSVYDCPRTTRLPLKIDYNPTNLEIYGNMSYWICDKREKKWIFNLDLDYFFDDEGMQIYSDDYVRAFAQNLHKAMENIAVLTIAMSPECCGSWGNSVHILNILSETFRFDEVLNVFTVSID